MMARIAMSIEPLRRISTSNFDIDGIIPIFATILRLIMKRLLIIVLSLVLSVMVFDASAQHISKKRVGIYIEDGNMVVAEASTTLVVELCVEHERFVPGPYARYAQKFLGARASLVEREEYRLVAADVVAHEGCYAEELAAVPSKCEDISFADVMPDRLSMADLGVEESAYEAAEKVYELRRARLDFVTGELGDGSIGSGAEALLRELDRLEARYLELFYGRRSVTCHTERVVIPVEAERPDMVIARFNPERGVVAKGDLSGEIILLSIVPSAMTYPANMEKGTATYRYANNAQVSLYLGQTQFCQRTLPIYEFGATVQLLVPKK